VNALHLNRCGGPRPRDQSRHRPQSSPDGRRPGLDLLLARELSFERHPLGVFGGRVRHPLGAISTDDVSAKDPRLPHEGRNRVDHRFRCWPSAKRFIRPTARRVMRVSANMSAVSPARRRGHDLAGPLKSMPEWRSAILRVARLHEPGVECPVAAAEHVGEPRESHRHFRCLACYA